MEQGLLVTSQDFQSRDPEVDLSLLFLCSQSNEHQEFLEN